MLSFVRFHSSNCGSNNVKLQTVVLNPLLAASICAIAPVQPVASQITISPTIAGQRITVARLEEKFATPTLPSNKTGVPAPLLKDAGLALEIQRSVLSERLTSTTLDRILAEHSLGPQTREALLLLADRSALLDPPSSELPKLPAPVAREQQRMLQDVSEFVAQSLTHLPDFFATRTVYWFYGVPPELNVSGLASYVNVHPRGFFSREITYRDGKEVVDPMKLQHAPTLPENGMDSQGEFGPAPAVILSDVSLGTLTFHHWEHEPSGLAAVYRYSVPEAQSHYNVNYSCNKFPFHARPAYHGSIAIDPDSGAILRLTMQADWKPNDPISHVAAVIEYGPVEIAGRSYICPTRAVAFMVEESNVCSRPANYRGDVRSLMLNRTTFTNYHKLGSTSRIILEPTADSPRQELPH